MTKIDDLLELEDEQEVAARIRANPWSFNDYDGGYWQPIHLAIGRKSITITKALLDVGAAHHSQRTRYGQPAIGYAAMYAPPAVFDLLLNQALEENKVDLGTHHAWSDIYYYSKDEGIFDHMVENTADEYAPGDYECTGPCIEDRVRNVDVLMCLYPEAVKHIDVGYMAKPVPEVAELVEQHLRCSALRRAWIKAVVLSKPHTTK